MLLDLRSNHSLFPSFLIVFLLSSAEVEQLVQLRLQEHHLQPLRVALQGCRLEVLHHPPHRRHHRLALVGQRGEAHHHCQLSVGVLAALQEVGHVGVHLGGQLEAVWFLGGNNEDESVITVITGLCI